MLAPDAIAPLHGSAAAAVTWRWRGQLQVTVIAKATFAFAPDAPMPRVDPQPVLAAEVHHGKNPTRSVRFTSEVAPHLGRADILFTGSAHAPDGAAVQSMPVRVAVYTEQRSLLDKQLMVQDAAGFQRMPLVYEKAPRGADGLENPFGVDAATGQPSILDARDVKRLAGFGPIARAWPGRKRLLGATQRKVLEGAIAEIPEAFDWAYYQAAPLDQRTDFLSGEEWILLEGLHPALPSLQTRLPSAHASARIHGLSGAGLPEGHRLDLVADLLQIDGDEQRCTLVFRKSFAVASEALLPLIRIAAGVELGQEMLPFPDPRTSWPVRAAAPSIAEVDDAAATLVVGGNASETVALAVESVLGRSQSTLPFRPAATLPLGIEHVAAKAPKPALPFQSLPAGVAPAIAAPSLPRERTATDTLALDLEAPPGEKAPEAAPIAEAAPIPEAPPEPAPAPVAAPIVSPAPVALSPTVTAEPPSSLWAPPPPPLPPPPPAPPRERPAPPTPSPALKQGLYGRFDRKG